MEEWDWQPVWLLANSVKRTGLHVDTGTQDVGRVWAMQMDL